MSCYRVLKYNCKWLIFSKWVTYVNKFNENADEMAHVLHHCTYLPSLTLPMLPLPPPPPLPQFPILLSLLLHEHTTSNNLYSSTYIIMYSVL